MQSGVLWSVWLICSGDNNHRCTGVVASVYQGGGQYECKEAVVALCWNSGVKGIA